MIEPLGVERLYLDNYFSIAKAQRDLGYQPRAVPPSRRDPGRVPVQFGAGRGDRLDHPLLTRHEICAHPGDQPRPAAPE